MCRHVCGGGRCGGGVMQAQAWGQVKSSGEEMEVPNTKAGVRCVVCVYVAGRQARWHV